MTEIRRVPWSGWKALFAVMATVVAFYGLACPPWAAAEPGPKQKVEMAYDNLREIEGTFRQKSLIRELEQEQEAEGRFYILRPDRVRWDYLKPSKQSTLIRSGEMFLWQEGSTEVWPSRYDEKAYGKTPLAVLSGLGSMEKDFRVSQVSDDVLLLVPREEGGFIKEIALTVRDGAFPVRSLKVTDLYENENTFEFLDVRVNQGFPANVFEPSSLLPNASSLP